MQELVSHQLAVLHLTDNGMDTNRVGLLGGMFDPVHNGHLKIAQSFLNSGLIHELWILPSFSPPHKAAAAVTDFEHRFEMLNLAFKGFKNISVNDIERQLPSPGYTLQTLTHLSRINPDTTFYWCIGSDNLNSFNTWHRFEDILSEWMLLVAKRPDYDIHTVDDFIKNRCVFVDHEPAAISSTAIRFALRSTRVAPNIPEPVLEYIRKNNLYSN